MTHRKEIQEQRMKEYFIQATKDILKSEGIAALSVRTIAERAGYSFATLYNYFKDVKDLVFFCVKDFQAECEEHIKNRTEKVARGDKKIKAIVTAYMEYFVQYPGVFDLFFMEKITTIGTKQASSELIVSFLDKLCAEEWEYCISKKTYTKKETEEMMNEVQNATTGLLLLYLNRQHPKSYTDFTKQTKQQLDRILSKE